MTAPAVPDQQSPLESALLDVHATLADLLVAADEQYAAVVARDHARLESVTRQQERLSARLARADSVRELKQRQARTAGLLEQSIDLAAQTLTFLQRLLTGQPAVYGARGLAPGRQSLLVDGRA